ncbi:uncharacterized protein LOC122464281 [Chelonia mydas]|uniref:uncharacterized protein LOC122464281 n=1 Tax=Chelonia mydas TaxID=8469 RepID=UPI001CA97359|nr:uncharacterized protein LOC122464281 [Chelonia mydas]
MERLKQMLGRKVPEPVGSSYRLPQEESGPCPRWQGSSLWPGQVVDVPGILEEEDTSSQSRVGPALPWGSLQRRGAHYPFSLHFTPSFPSAAAGVTLSPSLPGAGTCSVQLEDEEEDVSPEEAAIRVIQQHLQGRAERVQDRAKQLRFLHAIPTLCFSAQKQGQDTLEPHCSKAALMGSIAELIEDLPLESEPSSILSSSMATVCHLRYQNPPVQLP